MIPTEQDKELSKLLAYIDGSSDYNGAWFGEIPDGKTGRYWWRSELKQLITADRKRVELEARIDTATDILYGFSRTYKQEVTDSDGNVYLNDSHDYISRYEVEDHIARLKAQQEEV